LPLEAADKELLAFRSLLSNATDALKNPTKIKIIDGSPVSARDATQWDQKILNIDKWPDSTRVKTLIMEWQAARKTLESLWTPIPKDRQLSLVPPARAPGGQEDRNYRGY
jgi:hypothetical protein